MTWPKKFDDGEYIFVLKKHPLMKETCDNCLTDEEFSTLEMLFAADYVILRLFRRDI